MYIVGSLSVPRLGSQISGLRQMTRQMIGYLVILLRHEMKGWNYWMLYLLNSVYTSVVGIKFSPMVKRMSDWDTNAF